MELVPLSYYDGRDCVNQIYDNALDLRCGDAEDGINLCKAMRRMENIICNYDKHLWHKTAYG